MSPHRDGVSSSSSSSSPFDPTLVGVGVIAVATAVPTRVADSTLVFTRLPPTLASPPDEHSPPNLDRARNKLNDAGVLVVVGDPRLRSSIDDRRRRFIDRDAPPCRSLSVVPCRASSSLPHTTGVIVVVVHASENLRTTLIGIIIVVVVPVVAAVVVVAVVVVLVCGVPSSSSSSPIAVVVVVVAF